MLIHISHLSSLLSHSLFFFTDPPPTEIYTLSLHDALPISEPQNSPAALTSARGAGWPPNFGSAVRRPARDRKSTRLNSSHRCISYAVFCLKKKKKKKICIHTINIQY